MTKIGTGHAEAMARQGLKELRGSLYPESNVAQPPEYGLYGTQTPGEVAETRRDEPLDLEQEAAREGSAIDQRMPTAAEMESIEQERDRDREQELDRE